MISVRKIHALTSNEADFIWGLVFSCRKNAGYKNGQVIDNRFLVDTHKDTDSWVKVIDTTYVDELSSYIKLELTQAGFNEYRYCSSGETIYRYIRRNN